MGGEVEAGPVETGGFTVNVRLIAQGNSNTEIAGILASSIIFLDNAGRIKEKYLTWKEVILMQKTIGKERNVISVPGLAYAAAILFAIHLVTYLIPTIRDATPSNSLIIAELLALLGVAEHLLLFPVITALPAPGWAKAAGYGWLVIDIATDIMQLNGVPKTTYLALRYGGHISAALWITSAAYQSKGALRIIGLLVALDLAVYSFIAFLPLTFIILLPSLVLLPLWFVLVGRHLARELQHQQVPLEKV